jgi:hypothetical protein
VPQVSRQPPSHPGSGTCFGEFRQVESDEVAIASGEFENPVCAFHEEILSGPLSPILRDKTVDLLDSGLLRFPAVPLALGVKFTHALALRLNPGEMSQIMPLVAVAAGALVDPVELLAVEDADQLNFGGTPGKDPTGSATSGVR